MKLLLSPSTDPYFNIAAEEYLLHQFSEDIIFIYRNIDSVIIGSNQLPYKQVNMGFALTNDIPVVRRISGGGAVFHDLGNLNLSFFQQANSNTRLNYALFSGIFATILNVYLDASLKGNNSLYAGDYKISGHAQHIHRGRLLHHGTFLFDSDLEKMKKVLADKNSFFSDRSMDSVRAAVKNIKQIVGSCDSMNIFTEKVCNEIKSIYPDHGKFELSALFIQEIHHLVKNKYQTETWNYGKIKNYEMHKKMRINEGMVELNYHVAEGIIEKVLLKTQDNSLRQILEATKGKAHLPEVLLPVHFSIMELYPFLDKQSVWDLLL